MKVIVIITLVIIKRITDPKAKIIVLTGAGISVGIYIC